ncbi:MAG TPA: FtsX-like permease family protein [Acidimicrobiales bacterium]|nr:FtsX-like permease family protein [Acidimicrobiales bacterium]
MLRLALFSARGRLVTFTGALLALMASAVLTVAWGMQLESILRAGPSVERYAAAAAVVTGHQTVGGSHQVVLGERARVGSDLLGRIRAVPGVRAAVGDISIPTLLGSRPATAHGWSSTALTPYILVEGRPPATPDEVVTGYPAPIGSILRLSSTRPVREVTVVGVARADHPVGQQRDVFLTDAEANRLAGHPGQFDSIGVLSGPGFDASRLRLQADGASVLTGAARGRAEYPEFQRTRATLIPVTAAFGGLAMFIAIFVVATTMGLSIQQRERETALLRAVAATPNQVQRMIAWEAAIVGVAGSAAGIWPGILAGRALSHALVRRGIAPPNYAVSNGWLPAAAAVTGGVAIALLGVLAAGRRAARVPPTVALTEAAGDSKLLGPGRVVGGILALATATPLFVVSATTTTEKTAAATSELSAISLVLAVGFLGPVATDAVVRLLRWPLSALAPVGGFLACANLRTATRRYSSATTPIVLSVAICCTLLFSGTTIDHVVAEQRQAGLAGDLVVTTSGPGLPPQALNDARAVRGVQSATALSPTTLGPSLGETHDLIPALVLDQEQAGGLDPGVTNGSLEALHGDTIALGRHRASAAHAHVGDRVMLVLGDGARAHARVVAIYTRDLGFGDAILSSDLVAGHRTSPLLGIILVQTAQPGWVGSRLATMSSRYPGLRVADRSSLSTLADRDRRLNQWLGPLFVTMTFVYTAIAVTNTLALLALRRRRELALLRLAGATPRQVRSMVHWEAALIIAIGLGLGLAITATALLPLAHALDGSLHPYVPAGPLAEIVGTSAVLAVVALIMPTRRALRSRPVEAVGING